MVNGDHDTEEPRWWAELTSRHDLNSVHHVAGREERTAGGDRRGRPTANRGWFGDRTRPSGRRAGV